MYPKIWGLNLYFGKFVYGKYMKRFEFKIKVNMKGKKLSFDLHKLKQNISLYTFDFSLLTKR